MYDIGQDHITFDLSNTYKCFMCMYLSGMSPSLPSQTPSHQSCDTLLYNNNDWPFLNDSSRSVLPSKSYNDIASYISESVK